MGDRVYGSMLLGIHDRGNQVKAAVEYLTGFSNIAVQEVITDGR